MNKNHEHSQLTLGGKDTPPILKVIENEPTGAGQARELEKKVEHIEARLAKDGVMAELLGEYVVLKMSLGEP